jgi:OFA family oxalate/formate antiporter-like MFS transporter
MTETETEGPYSPDGLRSWTVAGVGATALAVTFGTPLSYGVFLDPVSAEYGVSKVALSTAFSLMLFLFFAGAGVVGILTTSVSSRLVVSGCGVAVATLAPSLYLFDSVVWLMVVFGVFGLLLGTVYVVLAAVVPQWFRRRRGTATGFAFAGIGLSLFVMPPVWEFALRRYGVRQGFLVVTAGSAALILLAGVVCARPPWADAASKSHRELLAWLGRLGRSRVFLLLFFGVGLSLAWYYFLAAYSVELFSVRGFSDAEAATGFGLVGGISIVSRLASGAVADRVGFRRIFLASIALASVGSILFLFSSLLAMALAVCCFGLGLGGVATTHVPFLLEVFSEDADIAVVGLFNVSFGIFGLATPPVVTLLLSYTGSYSLLVLVTLGITLTALWAVATSTGTRSDALGSD